MVGTLHPVRIKPVAEISSNMPEGNVIRTADLLGAFSLASDLGMGLHMEHGARSCYIGMHIAREMELPLEQRTELYYAEVVEGCRLHYLHQPASQFLACGRVRCQEGPPVLPQCQEPIGYRLMAFQVCSGGITLPNPGHSYAGLPGKGTGHVPSSGVRVRHPVDVV